MTRNEQTFTATLVGGDPLDLVEGALTMDDRWSPYVQFEATVATPADLTSIDPRELPRVDVLMQQRFGPEMQFTSDLTALWGGQLTSNVTAAWGGLLTSDILAPYARAWNDTFITATVVHARGLWIRGRTISDDGSTARLSIASGEAILQDLKVMDPFLFNAVSLRDLFAQLLASTDHAYTIALTDGLDDFAITPGAQPSTPTEPWVITKSGQTYWELLTVYIQQGNLRLWVDLDGLFRLTNRDAPGDGSTDIAVITGVEDSINRDRDDWADAVVLEYEPNPNNSGYQYVDSYAPVGYSKVFYQKLDAITPFTPFTPDPEPEKSPSELVYDRLVRRGHVMAVRQVNDFSIRPRQAATVDVAPHPLLAGVVEAITWDIRTKEMSATTRELEEV